MSCPELTAVLQRLAAAEAQIVELKRTRTRRAVSSVVLVATLAVSIIFVVPPVLHAESNMSVSHEIEAPFSIVSHGSVIFQVKESQDGAQRQAMLFNDHGDVVAAMLSNDGKGMVAVGDGTTDPSHLGGLKAAIAIDPKGSGTLEIRADPKKEIAIIQKTPNAQGLAIYRPRTGKIAIEALTRADVAAGLYLYSPSGVPFAELNSSEHGGRFWLGDTTGTGMIEAGVTDGFEIHK